MRRLAHFTQQQPFGANSAGRCRCVQVVLGGFLQMTKRADVCYRGRRLQARSKYTRAFRKGEVIFGFVVRHLSHLAFECRVCRDITHEFTLHPSFHGISTTGLRRAVSQYLRLYLQPPCTCCGLSVYAMAEFWLNPALAETTERALFVSLWTSGKKCPDICA